MAKKPLDAFIDTLVDHLMGEHKSQEHPSVSAMEKVSAEFHFLVGLKWDKLFQDYKENSGCDTEGCVSCVFAYKQNMRLLKFVRDIIEPHRAAYIELVKDVQSKNEAFLRLQNETQGQNRAHN